jgi:adenylate cyclase
MAGSPRARKALQGLLVGLASGALALGLTLPGLLDAFEGRTWDWRVRLLARPGPASGRIAVIVLDQASLDWGKEVNGLSWPWPRETYALVADFCRRGGAKALAFDVLYTEPSSYGVYDDEAFDRALAGYGRTAMAMFLGREQGTAENWPADLGQPAPEVQGLRRWLQLSARRRRALEFPRATFPIPEVAAHVPQLANTNLTPDSDGVYRRAQLFNLFDGRVVPSLALGTWLAGQAGPGADLSLRAAPGRLEVDGHRVPVDGLGRAVLRFRGPTLTHPAYSAAEILQSELALREGGQPKVDPALLEGRYVFFGFTAPGLFDLRTAPVQDAYPGVEVHATMLDNLLSGDFLRPLPWAAFAVLAILLAAAAGLAASFVSGAGRSALVYVAFLPLAPALSLGAYALGWWLPLVGSELGVALSLVASSLVNYATEGRQKRYLKSAFRQYLSPTVIEQLIAHPERLTLGGELREISIYFSDLQGFTTLSEMLNPKELTALLNEYLSAMTDIIQEEGGTIDKYEGDAIIAFWNAPVSQSDHAARAVRAALRCQEALSAMRPALRQRVGRDLFMRIGMNSGPAVVGNMGSRTRFDYTMLGDAVNLAARLEGVNKQFRTYTMVSAATLGLTGGAFPARELARVAVVGRKEPVTVFEPFFPEAYAARRALLESFAEALRAFYEGRFAQAADLFDRTAGEDPPAAAYLEKSRELAAAARSGGAGSPSQEWNGVWIMTSK